MDIVAFRDLVKIIDIYLNFIRVDQLNPFNQRSVPKMLIHFKNTKGQIALFSILIISAAILIVSIGVSSVGLNNSLMIYSEQSTNRSLEIADACVDEALLRLRRVYEGYESSYTGDTLDFDDDNCTITVTDQVNDKVIDVEAVVDDKYYKKVQVIAQWNPSFAMTSWKEVN